MRGGWAVPHTTASATRAHGESSLFWSLQWVMLNSVSSVTSRANSFVNLFFIESVAAAVGRGRNDSAHDSALPALLAWLVVGDGVVTGVLDLPLRGLHCCTDDHRSTPHLLSCVALRFWPTGGLLLPDNNPSYALHITPSSLRYRGVIFFPGKSRPRCCSPASLKYR